VTIDSQHRLETDFTGEVDDVANETQPIIFVRVGAVAVNERRLATIVSARNCLSSHAAAPLCVLPLGLD
jgi:hypothetical protein